MIAKLLTEHHLEFLSLKGGSLGSMESTLVKMSICWKSMPRLIMFKFNFHIHNLNKDTACKCLAFFSNSLPFFKNRLDRDQI